MLTIRQKFVSDADLTARPREVAAGLTGQGLNLLAPALALIDLIRRITPPLRGQVTARSGWLCPGDSPSGFVLPQGRVITAGDADATIAWRGKPRAGSAAGTLAGWQATVGHWAVGNPALLLAISAALAGPLLRLATRNHRALPVTAIALLDDPDLLRIRPGSAAAEIARRDDFKL